MIRKEDWSHDKLISILKSTKDLKIIKDNGKQILVKTSSAEPFAELFAHGMTTNWCFAVPDKEVRTRHYMSYVSRSRKQYILFDLEKSFDYLLHPESELSCVAFTTVKGTDFPNFGGKEQIIYCYTKINNSLLHDDSSNLESFIHTINSL